MRETCFRRSRSKPLPAAWGSKCPVVFFRHVLVSQVWPSALCPLVGRGRNCNGSESASHDARCWLAKVRAAPGSLRQNGCREGLSGKMPCATCWSRGSAARSRGRRFCRKCRLGDRHASSRGLLKRMAMQLAGFRRNICCRRNEPGSCFSEKCYAIQGVQARLGFGAVAVCPNDLEADKRK